MSRRPDIPRRPRDREGTPYDRPRSFRMSDQMWTSLRRTAQADGLTASFVLATLARDFAKGLLEVRDVTSGSDPSKSARISDDVWDALKLESKAQDKPASRVLVALAEEYVGGMISLHVHVVTSQES